MIFDDGIRAYINEIFNNATKEIRSKRHPITATHLNILFLQMLQYDAQLIHLWSERKTNFCLNCN